MDVNRFQIKSRKGLKHFLKVIHRKFLDDVDPRRSNLPDIMIQAELLTESDQESLSGKGVNVRRDQARKLWLYLNKMSVGDFTSSILPELCSRFPHILPSEWTDSYQDEPEDTYCFRHDVMEQLRPTTMADMLFEYDCLSLDCYTSTIENISSHKKVWGVLFDAIQRNHTKGSAEAVREQLFKHKLDVPPNLKDILSKGIPCTCDGSEHVLLNSIVPSAPAEKIATWLLNSHAGGSCTTADDLCSTEPDCGSLIGSGCGSSISQKEARLRSGVSGTSGFEPIVTEGVKECFRLILLGKQGSDKSATGNTILGSKVFDTNSSKSVSQRSAICELRRTVHGCQMIEVLDTPGLHLISETQEIPTSIVQGIVCMHPGPHALLYVLSLSDQYTKDDLEICTRLKTLFDENITRYMIIVLTHNMEGLEGGQKPTQDRMIKNFPEALRQVLRECNNRYIFFNIMAPNSHPQVEQLLSMVKNMVAHNGCRPYSCPRYNQNMEQVDLATVRRPQLVKTKENLNTSLVQQVEMSTEAGDMSKKSAEQAEKNNSQRLGLTEQRKRRLHIATHRQASTDKLNDMANVCKNMEYTSENQTDRMNAQTKKAEKELLVVEEAHVTTEREDLQRLGKPICGTGGRLVKGKRIPSQQLKGQTSENRVLLTETSERDGAIFLKEKKKKECPQIISVPQNSAVYTCNGEKKKVICRKCSTMKTDRTCVENAMLVSVLENENDGPTQLKPLQNQYQSWKTILLKKEREKSPQQIEGHSKAREETKKGRLVFPKLIATGKTECVQQNKRIKEHVDNKKEYVSAYNFFRGTGVEMRSHQCNVHENKSLFILPTGTVKRAAVSSGTQKVCNPESNKYKQERMEKETEPSHAKKRKLTK